MYHKREMSLNLKLKRERLELDRLQSKIKYQIMKHLEKHEEQLDELRA